jgi:hypothetical protein
MAYTEPTATTFVARFPRFTSVDDGVIGSALTEAESWVDESWAEADFTLARMLYAAHSLTLDGHGTGAESETFAAGAGGFKSMKSGGLTLDRFDRAKGSTSLETTSYGQRYLELLRRNKGGARVTSAPTSAV